MSNNNMHVIMYKILSYLYSCMKNGIEPDESMIDAEHLGIPYPYWCSVMAELVHHNYVSGILEIKAWGADIYKFQNPTVTMEGVEFARENSMMQKALTPYIKEGYLSNE